MCDDPKEGGAARGVSRVGYVGAHARFVRRAVRFRSESRRFCRGVRLRALFARFRRVVVAVPPSAWKWGVAVGVRWAVAMAMAVAFAVRLGRHRRPTTRASRAPSHPRIVRPRHGPWGDMTRRRGGVSPRETVQLRDTRHSALEHGQHRHCHSQSHTLYRHSTAALKAWNPRKQH